jgi:hypothetical protein
MAPELRPPSLHELYGAFESGEPAELRNYLTVPTPGRVVHYGSTTPILRGLRQRQSGLLVPAFAAAEAAPIDLVGVFDLSVGGFRK